MGKKRLKEQEISRKAAFLEKIKKATRANSSNFNDPLYRTLLQAFCDGLSECLMTQPSDPFYWLADYIRHTCKLAYHLEADPSTTVLMEMHKRRRILQHIIQDTTNEGRLCRQFLRTMLDLEAKIEIQPEETKVFPEDHEFLETPPRFLQEDWSLDVTHVSATPDVSLVQEMMEKIIPNQCMQVYFERVVNDATKAIVELQSISPPPSEAAKWFVLYLRSLSWFAKEKKLSGSGNGNVGGGDVVVVAAYSLHLKSLNEIVRKMEFLKQKQRVMHLRLETYQERVHLLTQEFDLFNLYKQKLITCQIQPRTSIVMEGTPIQINSKKKWISDQALLIPNELTPLQLQALRRAEAFHMRADEIVWKKFQHDLLEKQSSTLIQKTFRGFVQFRKYQLTKQTRHEAASKIQYQHVQYLYSKATKLPSWCTIGREVLIANSIAMKASISFVFYRYKDFPTGNYKYFDRNKYSIDQLKEICKKEEQSAGFATDGSLKRFIPRLLSQLKPINLPSTQVAAAPLPPIDPSLLEEPEDSDNEKRKVLKSTSSTSTIETPTTKNKHEVPGLYVKVYPSHSDTIVRTGIIVQVPKDKFGLIHVLFDGNGYLEAIPIQKISDRWKKIRIPIIQDQVTGMGSSRTNSNVSRTSTRLISRQLGTSTTITTLEEELEEELLIEEEQQQQKQQKRISSSSGNVPLESSGLSYQWIWEDQATKMRVEKEPKHTYYDKKERDLIIQKRQSEYNMEQEKKQKQMFLEACIRLQCAWRTKRARETFRYILQLRGKEKERALLVNQIAQQAAKEQEKNNKKKKKNKKKFLFFSSGINTGIGINTSTGSSKNQKNQKNQKKSLFFSKWFLDKSIKR